MTLEEAITSVADALATKLPDYTAGELRDAAERCLEEVTSGLAQETDRRPDRSAGVRPGRRGRPRHKRDGVIMFVEPHARGGRMIHVTIPTAVLNAWNRG